MTIDIKSMGYVRVNSTDLDAWTTFAGKVLGLAEGRGPNPAHQYWRIDEVSARLVVVPSDRDELAATGWELADHRALQEFNTHIIRALDERNAYPGPNGSGLHEHLGATALEFGRGRIHVIDPQPQMIQPDIGFRRRRGQSGVGRHFGDEDRQTVEIEIHAGLAIRLHIRHGGGIKHLLIELDGRLRIGGAQVNMIVGIDRWHPCRAPLLRENIQPSLIKA